jgi:hypothetical protein
MIQTLKKENLGDANAGHLEDDQEVAAQAGTTLRRYLDSSNKKKHYNICGPLTNYTDLWRPVLHSEIHPGLRVLRPSKEQISNH